MKINFDDLFSGAMPLTTIPSAFLPEHSPKGANQRKKVETQPSTNSKSSTMRNMDLLAESRQENSHSILQKLNKLTKMIEEKQESSKKHSKINIPQMSQKLYQPGPPAKKNCTKNLTNTKQQPKINSPLRKETKKNHYKSSAQIGFPRYVRLYNLNKINSIKNLYRAQSHRAEFDRQHVKEQFRTKASESYLENYVPFYDRLESEVNKSMEKQKFYQNNPHLACGELKQLFKPTTIPDKYKDKVECRYNRSSKSTKNTNELEQVLNSSLNTSFCSLDKSVQIINRVQDHFFNKMKVIFLNQSEQFILITENMISMLSEVEFKVLHNFIMEAEENPIHTHDFDSRLKDYYYNLPANERLELRNYQTRKKTKTTQELTQRDKQSQKSFKKKAPKPSKYLKKVQSFV